MMEAASHGDKIACALAKYKQVTMSCSPSPDLLSSAGSSPMSFDSDSHDLGGYTRKMIQITAPHVVSNKASTNSSNSNSNSNSNNNNEITASPMHDREAVKSPILIKYNYYDNSGTKMEQTNLDMNFGDSTNKIQRQLSPTFKQSLDQIVRNSQQQLASNAASASKQASQVSPSSPADKQHQQQVAARQLAEYRQLQLARRYKMSSYEQRCLRCKKTVYQMDKLGPLKDFTFYHQNCFKCRECGTKLTLKTYFNNQQSSDDREVYCHRHCPKTPAGKLDKHSVGIRAALNAPKVFEANAALPALACNNPGAPDGQLSLVTNQQLSPVNCPYEQALSSPNVDARALYIQHAVQQTRLQSIYKHSQVDKKISQFISRRLEFLEPKQKMLEMRHREEEDALFKAFELKWRQEESCISEQIRQEWQLELNKLLDKYRRQLSSISSGPTGAAPKSAACDQLDGLVGRGQRLAQLQQLSSPASASKRAGGNKGELAKQQTIEFERLNLEKTMTIKLDRKKETLKRKLKEFERQATAELVEKQSREMLALISMKLDEYKEEQKRKIGSDLEQFEAMESLANQLDASLQLGCQQVQHPSSRHALPASQHVKSQQAASSAKAHLQSADALGQANQPTLLKAPSPRPPQTSKWELYNSDEPDELFREIDQRAINVAREDQRTFTDLVHHLTRHCLTDVEKARAIFRWITVKNLNTMHFDSSVKPDTPLGLLRGIKNGSESYHVLFKRLCSYAGLHCVVIKGYSKSAGYQPGFKFEGSRFRNSWNAVYVAGAWRFVQCNWGARHLVSVAVMQDKHDKRPQASKNNGNSALAQLERIKSPDLKQESPAARANNVSRSHHLHHHHDKQQQLSRRDDNDSNCDRHDSYTANTISPSCDAQGDLQRRHQQAHLRASPLSPRTKSSSSSSSALLIASCSPTSSSVSSSSSSSSSAYSTSSSPSQSRATNNRTSLSPTARAGSSSSAATADKLAQIGSNNDSLRYEYDDHYFLTDPDEFIYEFFPLAPEWQLLKSRAISLSEFEQLPFVRSLFFKYGLYFPQQDIRSVLHADTSGAITVKIGMPSQMVSSLIFHYNLKYFDSDLEHYEGINLKRFVMQSVESGDGSSGQIALSNIVSFRVHLPENGIYILDIFANSTTPTQYITGEPMKFKSVCKFKIIAKNLKTAMIPLPDCASGEYGPMKATRLFGIIPLTHESGLICVQNDKRFLEIQFRMTRPLLDFMASLHKNGYDERQLSKSVKIFVDGDIVIITVKFFEDGQYGLDIYTRDQSLLRGEKILYGKEAVRSPTSASSGVNGEGSRGGFSFHPK